MRSLDRLFNWLLTLVGLIVVVGSLSVGWYIASGKWWWNLPQVAPYRERAEDVARQVGETRIRLPSNTQGGGNFSIPASWVDDTKHRCAIYISTEKRGLVITKGGKLLTTQAIPVTVGSGAPTGVFIISEVKQGSSPNEVAYWLQLSPPSGGSPSGTSSSGIYDRIGGASAREGSFAIDKQQLEFMKAQGCFEAGTPVLIQERPSDWTNSQNFNFGGAPSQ